jgi:hypothetical protein
VRDGCAEERHDGVADELLDRAASALELLAQARIVGRQHRSDVLGIQLLGASREPDEVGEEDGDDLALLPRLGGGRQLGAAGQAEPSDLGVLLPTLRTNRHANKPMVP